MIRAALIQMRSGRDMARNVTDASEMIRSACSRGAQFVSTPEMTNILEPDRPRLHALVRTEAEDGSVRRFSELARELAIWLNIGSLALKGPGEKLLNRSLLFAPDGAIAARYDKIHLFDIDLGGGRAYHESATIAAGGTGVLAPCADGVIGLSICYDIRFPHLYRAYAQAGASMLAAPAAFTKVTGLAHWHVLQRARAIENGAYVISPAQCGTLSGGAECFGHSLIVDPWGRVLADGGEQPGIVMAEIDLEQVKETRRRIPSLRHDRAFAPPLR